MSGPGVAEALRQAGLREPRTLTMAITEVCNLSCSHCWVHAGGNPAAEHVPTTIVQGVISEFAALGGSGIRLTGGEPLTHPDFLTLLRFARATGFSTLSLQTNAMLLDDYSVATFRELDFPGLTLQISIDGANAVSHDLVRGKGAFDVLLRALHLLVDAGLGQRISLFCTEMRHNLLEIPSLLELAEDLGVAWVTTGTLVLCGRAAADSQIVPPSPDQYLRLFQMFDSDPEFRRRYEQLGTVAALEWRRSDAPRRETCTFVENPYLSFDGKLYPCVLCHADPFCVSEVFRKGLTDAFLEGVPLWSGLLESSNRRAHDIEQCQTCAEHLTCSGGCLGRAWGSCGDIMAPDDRCEIRREVGKGRRVVE